MATNQKKPNEKLRYERELRGWSQKRMADLIDTTKEAVSLWECGQRPPSRKYQERLCTLFDKSAEELGFIHATQKPEPPLITYPTEQQTNQVQTLGEHLHNNYLDTIHELEQTPNLNSSDVVKRVAIIAHLLDIHPTLFTSDRHTVDVVADVMKLQEETLSSLYEDMLIMGWDSFRRSKSPQTITKIDEHVNKLNNLTRSASIEERTHWQSLLCRFSQLSTRIAQHRLDESRALQMAKQAIMIAIDLDDAELIASTFYGRGRVRMEYSNTASDVTVKKRYFEQAKADIDAALGYVGRVRVPLAGNIYLLAAEIYAHIAGNDSALRTQCERWQDNVALLVDSDKIEDDGTFLKLNPTALHHERAKTLLRFGKIEEAQRELHVAWETLQPNLFTWHMNMHLTQATLFIAKHEIEESTKASLKAYTLAKAIHSHKGEVEVQCLLEHLQRIDRNSFHVQNLIMITGDSI